MKVSEKDADGWITVKTRRGDIRTKTVMHATNRWASHLLMDFDKLIFGNRGSLASIKAPQGLIKHSGAQHWDHNVNVSLYSSLGPMESLTKHYRTTTSNYLHLITPSYLAGEKPCSHTTQPASSTTIAKTNSLTAYQNSTSPGLLRT